MTTEGKLKQDFIPDDGRDLPQPNSHPIPPEGPGTQVGSARIPSRTPFFVATNVERYHRQSLIRRFENLTDRSLICYVAGANAHIDTEDTIGFTEILHNIPSGRDLDLMIHTNGGDVDTVEKLVSMVRTKIGNATLRVVVPERAKSAGTLLALGADLIVMSDCSELGTIDPQVPLKDSNGNRFLHSVKDYLAAFDRFSLQLNANPEDHAARLMLEKLEPSTIQYFEGVKERSRQLAESLLRRGMFRNGGNCTGSVDLLLTSAVWKSHRQMISWEEASDPKLGLHVEYIPQNDQIWQEYWQIFCLQLLLVQDRFKLFESNYAFYFVEGREWY